MFPIIICEKDSFLLKELKLGLSTYSESHPTAFTFLFSTQTTSDLLLYLQASQPQNGLYLIDIEQQSALSDLEIIQQIQQRDPKAIIIALTTSENAAMLTLKRRLKVFAFLPKDLKPALLKEQLHKLLALAELQAEQPIQNENELTFSIGSRSFAIPMQTILFLKQTAIGKLTLYTTNAQYEFHDNLANIEIVSPYFFRCGKMLLVNLQNISRADFKSRTLYFPNQLSCSFSYLNGRKLKQLLDT